MRKIATTLGVLVLAASGMVFAGGGVALADVSHTHCTTTSADGMSTTDCTTTDRDRDGQCAARDAINILTCVPVLNNVNVLDNDLGGQSQRGPV